MDGDFGFVCHNVLSTGGGDVFESKNSITIPIVHARAHDARTRVQQTFRPGGEPLSAHNWIITSAPRANAFRARNGISSRVAFKAGVRLINASGRNAIWRFFRATTSL